LGKTPQGAEALKGRSVGPNITQVKHKRDFCAISDVVFALH